ncbi:peroxisome biogenesis factor 1 [Thrips palmi]|uniref:Peroxisomal ATPase PEX1 n=1 Tax=Thrips palmi TaxID=161013 RepID=A0A6P8Y4Z1_THRPL|nr:peroxisome biogenesis factor 1 [Thrips palmi]
MSGDSFCVQFVRSKTSFLFLPEKWAKRLNDIKKLEYDSTIKIVFGNSKTAYFSWQPTNFKEENVVGINATVASNLGLKEGDIVSLIIGSNPPCLRRVVMSPLSSDDLEMIESSSSLIQSTLLDQVRVIWRDQLLTAWISNSLPIVLHVDCMDPDVDVGRLEQMTEVVVGDPMNMKAPAFKTAENIDKSVMNSIVSSGKHFASSVLSAVKNDITNEEEPINHSLTTEKFQYIFRVHPLCNDQNLLGPLEAFLPGPCMEKLFHFNDMQQKSLFCKIRRLQDSDKPNQESSTEKVSDRQSSDSPHAYIRITNLNTTSLATKENYYSYDKRCIYLSSNLRGSLCLEIGSRVILSDFLPRTRNAHCERIDLLPYYALNCFDLGKNLIQYVDQLPTGLLLSNNMILTIPTEKGFVDAEVHLLPSTLDHFLALPGSLDARKVHVLLEKRVKNQEKLPSIKPFIPKNISGDLHLIHLQGIINEGLSTLKITLGLHESVNRYQEFPKIANNLLILGKSGCGKSSAAGALCDLLQGSPHYVHNAVIKCRPLKGKTVESLFKHLQSFIDDCVYHQPSILFLDDIECIAGVAEDQDHSSQISAYFNRVGRMILQLLSSLQSGHSVAIIATAPSIQSVASSLVPARGVHFFNTTLELPELSKNDRQCTFMKILNRKVANGEVRDIKCFQAVEECAKNTEGYCLQDLADLVDKATLAACMRQVISSKAPVIEDCDIMEALSNSTPMLLRGVDLQKSVAFGWDDIGGLEDVKTELKEVFEWPVMYPELFKNSPLRQQSGLLLYGAPGTGKTMLAAAVASECGLNFISVKGPELLSKYIGASEEAVRNVFFKAQSAKPCVLFFDEFDSLAPRRGHDNTGVTDRVVNQLLTQLDGVESLVGVWVLAATSRPDLLDPALLRPGRLDRSVLCPLPDEINRLAILQALSRKMNLDKNVDFSNIAAGTKGFTGADLQSILYTAQLSTVEVQQSQIQDAAGLKNSKEVSFKVTQSHIDAAAKNTRPSLTVQERNKFFQIYKKFGAGQKGGSSSVLDSGQRMTLA